MIKKIFDFLGTKAGAKCIQSRTICTHGASCISITGTNESMCSKMFTPLYVCLSVCTSAVCVYVVLQRTMFFQS